MKTNAFDALAGLVVRFRDAVGAGMTIRRALYLAVLLLPGTVVVLPLLLWLDRRAARGRASVFASSLSKHGPAIRHCPGGNPVRRYQEPTHAIPVDDLRKRNRHALRGQGDVEPD